VQVPAKYRRPQVSLHPAGPTRTKSGNGVLSPTLALPRPPFPHPSIESHPSAPDRVPSCE